MTKPKTKTVNDFSRCLDPLDMDATVIAVIEMSQSSWLVAGIRLGRRHQVPEGDRSYPGRLRAGAERHVDVPVVDPKI
jgi:hypothetical protein